MVFRNQYISNTHRKIQWVKQLNVNATIPTRKTEWPPMTAHHELTVTKMFTASHDWAVTWAVIELWPRRDWAVT